MKNIEDPVAFEPLPTTNLKINSQSANHYTTETTVSGTHGKSVMLDWFKLNSPNSSNSANLEGIRK